MEFWLTLEIYHGEVTSADRWRDERGESLIEAAITNTAREWQWHNLRWGVILEVLFDNEQTRDALRDLPAVVAALDAVPTCLRAPRLHRPPEPPNGKNPTTSTST